MALPKQQPELNDTGSDADSEREAGSAAAAPSRQRPDAGHSPARYLQARLAHELHVPKGPSVRGPLTVILVLSLASSVAVLSLYSMGWI